MIQEFVEQWERNKDAVRNKLAAAHPTEYETIVRHVIEALGSPENDESPDPDRIHVINDGHYQGTLVFVIGARCYEPCTYWYVFVAYGSCSTCDTLKRIRGYDDEPPTDTQIADYMTLALHIVQGLKSMGSEEASDANASA